MVDPVTGHEVIDEGDERRFLEARLGDALFCPFECEECAFLRLTHYSPNKDNPADKWLCDMIRRANLDAFWGREPSTIAQKSS